MKKLTLLVLLAVVVCLAQTSSVSIIAGVIKVSAATHTAPVIVKASTGALPASGCVAGELAIVTGATLGQQIYENSGVGACT